MKHLLSVALLGTLLLLTACPLQTAEPIDNGSYSATSWLTGKWNLKKADGTTDKIYLLKKGNKPGHMEVYVVTDDGLPETSFRPIIFSKIGNSIFISAFEKGDEATDEGYYIFKLVRKTDRAFDLLPVKENLIDTDSKGPAIREWLSRNENGDIYEVKDTEHYSKE